MKIPNSWIIELKILEKIVEMDNFLENHTKILGPSCNISRTSLIEIEINEYFHEMDNSTKNIQQFHVLIIELIFLEKFNDLYNLSNFPIVD